MSKIYYKVSYLERNNIESEPISLVFKKIENSPSENLIKELISSLESSKENDKIKSSIRNIKNVLELSDDFSLSNLNDYIVVLFESKETKEKEGFLIANEKRKGKVIIAYWPFHSEENISQEKFRDKCRKLIDHEEGFNKILITKQF